MVVAQAVKLSIDLGKHNREGLELLGGLFRYLCSSAKGRGEARDVAMAKPPMAPQGWGDTRCRAGQGHQLLRGVAVSSPHQKARAGKGVTKAG